MFGTSQREIAYNYSYPTMHATTLYTLWLWLFRIWGISEVAIVLATRTRKGGGKVQDGGSMLLLWIVIAASITACIWLTFRVNDVLFPASAAVQFAIREFAVALLAFGIALRWTAIYQLGRAFSVNVAIRDEQKLQTGGLYSLARHPSYTAMLVIFLSLGLYAYNFYSLAVILIFPFAALVYRIHVEERALRGAFGQQYVDYSARVKRLIPGIY
jgi:protein-S-isoprenylcysteine O-methyltransferase Ste14